jgi:hypothetical protein
MEKIAIANRKINRLLSKIGKLGHYNTDFDESIVCFGLSELIRNMTFRNSLNVTGSDMAVMFKQFYGIGGFEAITVKETAEAWGTTEEVIKTLTANIRDRLWYEICRECKKPTDDLYMTADRIEIMNRWVKIQEERHDSKNI